MRSFLKPCLALSLVCLQAGFAPALAVEAVYQVTQTGIPVVEITAQFESSPGWLLDALGQPRHWHWPAFRPA